jgi:hypothetical protein
MNGHDPALTVRAHVSLSTQMHRLHGEIERNLYAAEIACRENVECTRCSFRRRYPDPTGPFACTLPALREIIGEGEL